MTTLGLDIGGSKVLAALVDRGRVLAEMQFSTDITDGPARLIDNVAESMAPWDGQYDRVGAAVTGTVHDGQWQALNRATLDLPGPFPLIRALESGFRRPSYAVNDAHAAAWGEFRLGAGRGVDMVYLTVSTGLGGGIVFGGRLLGGVAGSFGQTRDDSGQRLEEGLAGRWFADEALARGHLADARQIFARASETWAAALIESSAARVATLCGNIQLMLDPACIVLGGGIGLAPGYLDRVRATLSERDLPRPPSVVPAALGSLAGVIGVADLATTCLTENNQMEYTP